jgi:hypothetical protein
MAWNGHKPERDQCRSPDLANLKREISEKKWAEARRWAGGRVATKKYRVPREQRPDRIVTGSSKRLASSF